MVAHSPRRPLAPPTYRTHAAGLPPSPYQEHLARTARENASLRRGPGT